MDACIRARPRACSWIQRLALCALLAGTAGCFAVVRTNYERPIPTDEAVASIVPGVTTRTELVRRFGPPAEDRRPTVSDRGRGVIPGLRQVYEEHDLLSRRIAIWERAQRRDFVFTVPLIYRYHRETHETDRLFVLFDEDGVVETFGCSREIQP